MMNGEQCVDVDPGHQMDSQHSSGGPTEVEEPESTETQSMEHEPAVSDGVHPTPGSDIPYDDHKLFVGGLSSDTTESKLEEYFLSYGTVSEVTLKYDPVSKRSRGFAFIVFAEEDAVDKVLAALPHNIDGKEVDTKKAIPHAIHQQLKQRTKKIFVGGVPRDMPEEVIKQYFIQFGEIEEVALVTDKGSNKRRGFCFVTFISEDSVDTCCLDNFHTVCGAEVEVKRATPREQDRRYSSHRGGRGRSGGGGGYGEAGARGGHWGAPYGGYAAYYPYYPSYPQYQPYGGGYGGYAGGYPYDYAGRREDSGYGSRYGPKKSYSAHHAHTSSSYHPYSR